QLPREPMAAGESLDQGGASRQDPRGFRIVVAIEQDLTLGECMRPAAEPRREEREPDDGRKRGRQAGHDEEGLDPEKGVRPPVTPLAPALPHATVRDAAEREIRHVTP